ncbi:MAG: tRNA (N6-isopentenyl adenosine(37)-C2)-methylthiotransferase MiaB [Candidatus Cyclobacteriaceae bacterium M3_2C_046]
MSELIKNIDIIQAEEKEAQCQVKVSPNKDTGKKRSLYIESYGCQMNFSDSEIVMSIMQHNGFDSTSEFEQADAIFINTCSIREKAEQTIRKRLTEFNVIKRKKPDLIIGVLGCMAERLKHQLLEQEKIVDIVAGPDAYRDLPKLVFEVEEGHKAVNTFLSREETYADINPVRLNSNGITAFISIMRGCDNMCSFCVVPFTRGRERSREPESILKEAQDLFHRGYREVTLLGQNVDSYKWSDQDGKTFNFAELLAMVAEVHPDLRVRFSTSHPKDMTDDVLRTMNQYDNICKYIHLPAQSGNSRILDLMKRTYTREWYMNRIDAIRNILGEACGISSDIIAGFCSESEEEHQDTLSLMEYAQYDFSYMFMYSERPGTFAAKKLQDDIPLPVKKRRLSEIIEKQKNLSLQRNQQNLGNVYKVLIEGTSKKSDEFLQGRNSANKVIVFPRKNYSPGQYVEVLVKECTSATLIGEAVN